MLLLYHRPGFPVKKNMGQTEWKIVVYSASSAALKGFSGNEKLSPQVTDEVSLRSSVFLNNGCYASYTSSVSPLGCHLIDYGMIAPGNHLDFRSAARSTTLKGKALRR